MKLQPDDVTPPIKSSGEPVAGKSAPQKQAWALLAVGCAILLYVQAGLLVLGISPGIRGISDFRQMYTAGYMVRTGQGHQLYDYELTEKLQESLAGTAGSALPFNHLAVEALLFVPLSIFRFQTAYILMLVINGALLFCGYGVLRRHFGTSRALWKPLPFCVFACFIPFGVTLVQGQDSILMAVLFAAAAMAIDDGRDEIAGVLLAAALFKFQFVLPVIALFILWRRWKLVAAFLAGAAAMAIASVAVAGTSAITTYFHYLSDMSVTLSKAGQNTYGIRPAAMPNLRGLISVLFESLAGGRSVQALTVIFSLALIVWVSRQRPTFAIAIVTAILVSYHCLYHDLSLLVVPLVIAPHLERSSARSWAWSATIFAGVGMALAWDVPRWMLSILMFIFLLHLAQNTQLGWPERLPAHAPSPART